MEIISLFLIGLETDRLVEYLMGPAKGSDNYVILSRGLVYTIAGVPPCSTAKKGVSFLLPRISGPLIQGEAKTKKEAQAPP